MHCAMRILRARSLRQAWVYAADHRGHGATAGTPSQVAYFSDEDGGFMLAVKDMALLVKPYTRGNEGLPVFIFGHSMGSSLVRVLAAHDGKTLAGVILTGTGRISAACRPGSVLARCIMAVFGDAIDRLAARHRV